jgi:hypothetical protein
MQSKKIMINTRITLAVVLPIVVLTIWGCALSIPAISLPSSTPLPPSVTLTPRPSSTRTLTPLPTATRTPLPPTLTASATSTPEPAGCQRPSDDYTLVHVNGWLLNKRTLEMLQHAATLYAGELDITGSGVTQGSYHDNGAASFGTHLGGGAVDISVMRKGTYTILKADIPLLLTALRAAGFAAWYRDFNELFPGSAPHIHAIAIADKQLSQPAQDQLTGPWGYFRGFAGLPVSEGTPPAPDRFGGPVICQWMIDAGYSDLRVTPTP